MLRCAGLRCSRTLIWSYTTTSLCRPRSSILVRLPYPFHLNGPLYPAPGSSTVAFSSSISSNYGMMGTDDRTAVFWDYENLPTSASGCEVAQRIRHIAFEYGLVTRFRAYAQMSDVPLKTKSELQGSGVSLIDCPHNGQKDVADKMIVVDMFSFAMDNPAPATVILMTGDGDMACAAARLRDRGYRVVLITKTYSANDILKYQASITFEWCQDGTIRPVRCPSHSTEDRPAAVTPPASLPNNRPAPTPRQQPNVSSQDSTKPMAADADADAIVKDCVKDCVQRISKLVGERLAVALKKVESAATAAVTAAVKQTMQDLSLSSEQVNLVLKKLEGAITAAVTAAIEQKRPTTPSSQAACEQSGSKKQTAIKHDAGTAADNGKDGQARDKSATKASGNAQEQEQKPKKSK